MPTEWISIAQLGGMTTVAVFAILILQKTWEGRLADQKTTQEVLTQQWKVVLEALKAATEAMTDVHRSSQDSIAASRESIITSRELCQEVRGSLAAMRRTKKGDKQDV